MTRPLDPEGSDSVQKALAELALERSAEPAVERSVESPAEKRDSASPRGASFGTALGAAMLGLEGALRREPPAEVLVHEHRPIRGLSGDGGTITIEFPDDAGLDPHDPEPDSADPGLDPHDTRPDE